MGEVLTTSAEARKMALSLKHVEYGGQLLDQLMQSSKKMETLHERLNELITKDVSDDARYMKLANVADAQLKWWEKAKAWIFKTSNLHVTFLNLWVYMFK